MFRKLLLPEFLLSYSTWPWKRELGNEESTLLRRMLLFSVCPSLFPLSNCYRKRTLLRVPSGKNAGDQRRNHVDTAG